MLRTLSDIDVTAREAVEGGEASVHVHAMLRPTSAEAPYKIIINALSPRPAPEP